MHKLTKSPITLRMVWTDYQQTRSLKAGTVASYCHDLNVCLEGWLDMPIHTITEDMVRYRHAEISTQHGARGTGSYLANRVMRTFRALFTYALHRYAELSAIRNPVSVLSHLKAWNKQRARRTLLLPHQLKSWFQAVMSLSNETARDYLLFVLLTGTRRTESALLRWEDVSFEHGAVTFRDTKNGDDHVLPLTDYVQCMLERRREANPKATFVFESGGKLFSAFNKTYLLVCRMSGLKFTMHDLRRSFISIADSLDIPYQVLKRLLNHRNNDVTTGYIVHSIERLRLPMQSITDAILFHATSGQVGSVPVAHQRQKSKFPVNLFNETKPDRRQLRGPLETRIYEIAVGFNGAMFDCRQVHDAISKDRPLTYSTVSTTIRRLVDARWFELVSKGQRTLSVQSTLAKAITESASLCLAERRS